MRWMKTTSVVGAIVFGASLGAASVGGIAIKDGHAVPGMALPTIINIVGGTSVYAKVERIEAEHSTAQATVFGYFMNL